MGLIVARSQMEAIRAAKLVQVKYKDMQTPVLTIRDALKHQDRITDHVDFGPVDLLDVGNLEGTFTLSIIIRLIIDYNYQQRVGHHPKRSSKENSKLVLSTTSTWRRSQRPVLPPKTGWISIVPLRIKM